MQPPRAARPRKPPVAAPELVDRADGPILFAVPGGGASTPRELAPHRHARGQLFASSLGLLTVETPAGRWLLPPDRALWVPPDVEHAALAHGTMTGWSLYVHPAACDGLPRTPRALQVTPLLREAIARAARWTPAGRVLTAGEQRLAAVILDEIAAAVAAPLHLPMPTSPRLAELARALIARPDDPRDLDAWARAAAMSTRSFTRRFRGETGMPFAAWRAQLRMLLALERIAGGASITAVGLDLGYTSPSAFSAAFRRVFGTPPHHFSPGAR
ncbi:MAG TPA: helix-turn-helix transcriptional regulator [Kofleriaceae bacterium]|nr:helix-turn-helix transcriptional regulator [Kofleriaceae bacterium]